MGFFCEDSPVTIWSGEEPSPLLGGRICSVAGRSRWQGLLSQPSETGLRGHLSPKQVLRELQEALFPARKSRPASRQLPGLGAGGGGGGGPLPTLGSLVGKGASIKLPRQLRGRGLASGGGEGPRRIPPPTPAGSGAA